MLDTLATLTNPIPTAQARNAEPVNPTPKSQSEDETETAQLGQAESSRSLIDPASKAQALGPWSFLGN